MHPLVLKLACIAAALGIWFKTQQWIGRLGQHGLPGIGDVVHRLTGGLHRYFLQHDAAANRALMVSSLVIDVLGLSLLATSLLGPTFAPFLALILLFMMRQISQVCCTLPPPPGMIWRNPGFPSALVTYDVANDFFFSGHTALAVLAAIQLCQHGPWWLAAPAVLAAAGEAMLVLVLRAHYTMDVITGALAAAVASNLASRVAPAVDHWLLH